MQLVFALLAALPVAQAAEQDHTAHKPLLRTVDLDRGESQLVELADGTRARVKLLDVEEERDGVRSAIRQARVKVEVNGQTTTLVSANYRLPITVGGVQIDCPVTRGYYKNCDPFEDSWGLDKDARLRLWPAGSPWAAPGTFVYPIKQRWFAGATQMANEPSFVDGGDAPTGRPIYYHSGLDIGGLRGPGGGRLGERRAGRLGGRQGAARVSRHPVLQARRLRLRLRPRRPGVVLSLRHLKSIDPAIRPGERVRMGQKIGVLGKEGSSGGWSHLHFDIKSRQPSGKWGIQEGYAFLWEAYRREHKPQIIAVARPHHLIWAGEKVVLDGSRSWSAAGKIERYEWTFTDGTAATGPRVERTYDKPGEYSEVLKVVDARGRVDYDFAVVLVIDKALDGKSSPTIHASYAPTLGIRPGDPVTFKVRTFFGEPTGETWDFGDGSPPVTVRSDGNAKPLAPDGYAETVHRYEKPGHYLVRVERTGPGGARSVARLQVRVGEGPEE